jgi:hypothetical protein
MKKGACKDFISKQQYPLRLHFVRSAGRLNSAVLKSWEELTTGSRERAKLIAKICLIIKMWKKGEGAIIVKNRTYRAK